MSLVILLIGLPMSGMICFEGQHSSQHTLQLTITLTEKGEKTIFHCVRTDNTIMVLGIHARDLNKKGRPSLDLPAKVPLRTEPNQNSESASSFEN